MGVKNIFKRYELKFMLTTQQYIQLKELMKKYITARVREYWMVDPDKKKVVVYDLEHNELPAIYGFEDQVPVKIFAGKCQIDFSEIYSYIEFLFEKE